MTTQDKDSILLRSDKLHWHGTFMLAERSHKAVSMLDFWNLMEEHPFITRRCVRHDQEEADSLESGVHIFLRVGREVKAEGHDSPPQVHALPHILLICKPHIPCQKTDHLWTAAHCTAGGLLCKVSTHTFSASGITEQPGISKLHMSIALVLQGTNKEGSLNMIFLQAPKQTR